MSTKENVRKTTKNTLGKYKSDQLLTKLDEKKLLGLSKEVAIEILEFRKVDVSKYKADSSSETVNVKIPSTKTKIVTSISDEEDAVKEKVRKPRTTLTQDQLAEILKRSKAGESIFRIRVDMNLSYSAVKKIVGENK